MATMLLGFAFYTLGLLSDLRMLPYIFITAALLKLGALAPLALLSLVVVVRTGSARLRESMVPATAIVLTLVNIYLTLASTSPLAAYAQYSALLAIIMPNLIIQARFWYAVFGSLATFGI
jgi:hypothetical protein